MGYRYTSRAGAINSMLQNSLDQDDRQAACSVQTTLSHLNLLAMAPSGPPAAKAKAGAKADPKAKADAKVAAQYGHPRIWEGRKGNK